MSCKSPDCSAKSNKFISRPKTISALELSPSKIILFNNVAALSTATNSISAVFFFKYFSIIGPGPHSETKESYVYIVSFSA